MNEADSTPIQNLGKVLSAEFQDAANRRRGHEEIWLEDLRLYKGKEDPETEAILSKRGGSRLHIRLTKHKVRTVLARLMDLLFPSNGEKNWGIRPTPNPQISDAQMQSIASSFMQQAGREPGPQEMNLLVREVTEKAAERMARTMSDQLAETPKRSGYRQEVKRVLKSGLIYGTGILKGPLVRYETRKAWVLSRDKEGNTVASLVEVEDNPQPFFEFVPHWAVYPEPDATDINNCRYIWQEHIMTRDEVLSQLTSAQAFDEDRVRAYLAKHKAGDAVVRNYIQEMRTIGAGDEQASLDNRYSVLERWGYLSSDDLREAGVELPDEVVDEYYANIWIMGDEVIKAVLNPIEGVRTYYYFWYYDHDETSIWGEGISRDMRDPVLGFNASVRKMVDSYAVSGPMFGLNATYLSPGEDPRDVHSGRVWLFEGAQEMKQAMNIWNVPADVSSGLTMAQFFQNFGDEVSAPRFMQGSSNVKGAGETASGLSMLMGAVNVNLKDLVKDFDDFITSPFIEALYHWNMNFSDDPSIMGDFEIEARGSTALMAREIRSQKLLQAMQVTESPRFAKRCDDDKLLRELFKAIEVDVDLLKPKDQYLADQQQEMAAQAAQVAKAQVTEVMNEMRARGMQPEQILQQMLAQSINQAQQAAQAERV